MCENECGFIQELTIFQTDDMGMKNSHQEKIKQKGEIWYISTSFWPSSNIFHLQYYNILILYLKFLFLNKDFLVISFYHKLIIPGQSQMIIFSSIPV